MTYTNFKKIVPAALQEKVKQLAEGIDFREIVSGPPYRVTEQTVNEIEGNYQSGWIPHQDGGFSVDQFYMSDDDGTFHFTEKQTDSMSDQAGQCLESFLSDNDIEEMDYDDQCLLDRLHEYENEWWEPALLQFQIFVERKDKFDDSSPMSVVCRLSINYSDAPYYREMYAEDIKFIAYEFDEFMSTENCAIIEQFKL
jgi:hypothetical protein